MHAYQFVAITGSALLAVSGFLRYAQTGSPKEPVIALLYFLANLLIFCF